MQAFLFWPKSSKYAKNRVQAKVYDAKQKLIDTGQVVTSSAIIEIVSGAEQRRRGLMLLFKEHNDEMKRMIGKGFAKGTWTNFDTSYNHLLKFLETQYHTDENDQIMKTK